MKKWVKMAKIKNNRDILGATDPLKHGLVCKGTYQDSEYFTVWNHVSSVKTSKIVKKGFSQSDHPAHLPRRGPRGSSGHPYVIHAAKTFGPVLKQTRCTQSRWTPAFISVWEQTQGHRLCDGFCIFLLMSAPAFLLDSDTRNVTPIFDYKERSTCFLRRQ